MTKLIITGFEFYHDEDKWPVVRVCRSSTSNRPFGTPLENYGLTEYKWRKIKKLLGAKKYRKNCFRCTRYEAIISLNAINYSKWNRFVPGHATNLFVYEKKSQEATQ